MREAKDNSTELLAEIEEIIRSVPPRATIRQSTDNNFSWLGRALAALERWNSVRAMDARASVRQLDSALLADGDKGYRGLLIILNQARSDLRFATIGPISAAIGHGLVFDYFDGLRKIIELATNDLFFVDPYLDAEFVSRYLPCVASGVSIRMLAREKLTTLVPALKLFAQQSGRQIALRSAPNFHDRYVIVDGTSCYQSGASFKDGARTAPTTITQITDAFTAVHNTYENLWQSGNPEM